MNSNSSKYGLFTATSFDFDLSSSNNKQQSNKFSIGLDSQELSSLNPFSNRPKVLLESKPHELTPKTIISYQETMPTIQSLPTFEKFAQQKSQEKRYLLNNDPPSQNVLMYSRIFQQALKDKKIQKEHPKKNHNIGISILDSEGNFIWADQKTQCLLGTKIDNKSMTKNLFKMMISFSKFHLLKKFLGQRIMQRTKNSIRFKYLIYSLDCKNKYIKKLKKLGIKKVNLDETHKFHKQQILFKYLKVLSSEAIKIDLKIPKEVIQNKQLIQKYNIKLDESLEKQIFLDLQKNSKVVDGYYVFKGVLLKTRLAQSCPNYNYQLLHRDEKIQKFEEQVSKSIGIVQLYLLDSHCYFEVIINLITGFLFYHSFHLI